MFVVFLCSYRYSFVLASKCASLEASIQDILHCCLEFEDSRMTFIVPESELGFSRIETLKLVM